MAALRVTSPRFSPKPASPTLYWTSQAREELAVLIPLAPIQEREGLTSKIESYAKERGRESVNGQTVLLYFKGEF